MLVTHFFDLVPIWALLIGTILLMIAFIELGFSLGKKALANSKKAQISQVRAIMGAGLGLLAFMLAFTFNTAQTHFEVRVQSLAEEARIARNAFMQADLLVEPARSEAKRLLNRTLKISSVFRKKSNRISGCLPLETMDSLKKARSIQRKSARSWVQSLP
jgi:hypothetical protein